MTQVVKPQDEQLRLQATERELVREFGPVLGEDRVRSDVQDVVHLELNGHILIPLQNVASLHCSSRCDAPEPDWPPRGLTDPGPEEPDDHT